MDNIGQVLGVGRNEPSYDQTVNLNNIGANSENLDFVRFIHDSVSKMDSPKPLDNQTQGKFLRVKVESQSHIEKSNHLGETKEIPPPLIFRLDQIPEDFSEEFRHSISGESVNPDSDTNANGSLNQTNDAPLTNIDVLNSDLIMGVQNDSVNQNSANGLSGIALPVGKSGFQVENIQDKVLFPLSNFSNESELTNFAIDAARKNPSSVWFTTGTRVIAQAVEQELLTDSIFLASQQRMSENGEESQRASPDKSALVKENSNSNSASDRSPPKNLDFLIGKEFPGEIKNLLSKVAEKQMNLSKAIDDQSQSTLQKSENNLMNLAAAAKSSVDRLSEIQTMQFNPKVEKNNVLVSKKMESVKTENQNSFQQTSHDKNKTNHSGSQEVKAENVSEKNNDQQGKTNSSDGKASSITDQALPVESNARASQSSLASTIAEDNSGLNMTPNSGKTFLNDSGFQRIIKGSEGDFSSMKNSIPNFDEKDVVNQVLRRFSLNVRNQSNEFFMRLEPEFLGSLRIRVLMNGDNLSAKVFTNTILAKEVLEKNAHILTNALSEQGIKVEKFHVEVSGSEQTNDFSSFGQKNQSGSGQEYEIFNKYPRNEYYPEISSKTVEESPLYKQVRPSNGKALIDLMI